MQDDHEFTLTDADGVTHTYYTTAIDPLTGLAISAELAALVTEPVAGALGGILGGASVEDVLDTEVGREALQKIDLDALGRHAATQLRSPQNQALVLQLLATTSRDGVQLGNPQTYKPNATAINAAYRRNYAELFMAAWEVVKYNRFLPLESISGFATTFASKMLEKTKASTDGTQSEPPDSA